MGTLGGRSAKRGATRYSPVFPVWRGEPGRRRGLPARRVDRRAQPPARLDNSAARPSRAASPAAGPARRRRVFGRGQPARVRTGHAHQRAAVVRAWLRFQAAHRRLDRHRLGSAAANESLASISELAAVLDEPSVTPTVDCDGDADERAVRVAGRRVSRPPAGPAHRGGVMADRDPRRSTAAQARARAGRGSARARPIPSLRPAIAHWSKRTTARR